MEIRKVAVIGAGTMGNGIAQAFAASGYAVVMCDVSEPAVKRGLDTIAQSLERMLAKQKIGPADKDATLARIRGATELNACADADIVVEAATENEALKLKIFGDLDRICPPGAILASNTSSISLTRIAAATRRPAQVIGMHFMNPVPMMQLVEIIRAIQTSDEVYRTVEDLSRKLGKTPVSVKNSPGFISNRVLLPMINEAICTLYEGLATAEDIDTVMKLGMNHPMGPLTLADLIGLDTCLSIMEVLYAGFNDSKYRPCPLLKEMVDAGYLGRKSGRGFYDYSKR